MIHPEKHYHLSFPVSAEQAHRARAVIEQILEEEDKQQYADELIEVIDAISQSGLSFYFEKPLKMAGVNIISRKSVQVAVNTGRKGVMVVARKMIRGMSDEQLHTIASFMDSILFEKEQ